MKSLSQTKKLLYKVKNKKISVPDAVHELAEMPFADIGMAKIDHHRMLRRGFPEVVMAEGKRTADLEAIVRHFRDTKKGLIITRISKGVYDQIKAMMPGLVYDTDARMAYLMPKKARTKKVIAIVTAGTSDYRVAREAELTAELFGSRVTLLADVGVAGVHRLFKHIRVLRKANVIIVVAGMEGALASVVSGLISRPVVAVPTSVGYGASFKGIAPLLTMLNSCSPGVVVVNIDNGFGAGYFASMINN